MVRMYERVLAVIGIYQDGVDCFELSAMGTYLVLAVTAKLGENEMVGILVNRCFGLVTPSAMHRDSIIRASRVEPHPGGRAKIAHTEQEVILRLAEREEHGLQLRCSRVAFAFRQFVVGRRLTVHP